MACPYLRSAASGRASLRQLGGATPAIKPQWVRQLGIRSVDAGERRFVHEQRLAVFDMRCIDEMGMRRAMELALADLEENTHLHVSFDVDVLDPEIAPGVGTTVPGGMSYREAQLCMEMIADTGLVGSLDIMELNPALDVRNKTATARGRSGRIAVRQEHAHAASRGRAQSRRARWAAAQACSSRLNPPHGAPALRAAAGVPGRPCRY